MHQTQLHLLLDDEQLDDLFSALCEYRDHFIELVDSNTDTDIPRIRESTRYWGGKAHRVQGLIDQLSDQLYGTRQGEIA